MMEFWKLGCSSFGPRAGGAATGGFDPSPTNLRRGKLISQGGTWRKDSRVRGASIDRWVFLESVLPSSASRSVVSSVLRFAPSVMPDPGEGEMMAEKGFHKCLLCGVTALLFCEVDNAFLCADCDTVVHGANAVAQRHKRTRI